MNHSVEHVVSGLVYYLQLPRESGGTASTERNGMETKRVSRAN